MKLSTAVAVISSGLLVNAAPLEEVSRKKYQIEWCKAEGFASCKRYESLAVQDCYNLDREYDAETASVRHSSDVTCYYYLESGCNGRYLSASGDISVLPDRFEDSIRSWYCTDSDDDLNSYPRPVTTVYPTPFLTPVPQPYVTTVITIPQPYLTPVPTPIETPQPPFLTWLPTPYLTPVPEPRVTTYITVPQPRVTTFITEPQPRITTFITVPQPYVTPVPQPRPATIITILSSAPGPYLTPVPTPGREGGRDGGRGGRPETPE